MSEVKNKVKKPMYRMNDVINVIDISDGDFISVIEPNSYSRTLMREGASNGDRHHSYVARVVSVYPLFINVKVLNFEHGRSYIVSINKKDILTGAVRIKTDEWEGVA